MKKKILWAGFGIWVGLTILLLVWSQASIAATVRPAPIAPETFIEMLREALKRDPELILGVLRENSEAVLDVAQHGSDVRRRRAMLTQWKRDLGVPKEVLLTNRPQRGQVDAPITIVAFSDFTCPYCQQASLTVQKLLKDYAGKVKYVFKHYPLDGQGPARLGAEYYVAAALQNHEKAWQLYDLLFSRRNELLADPEATLKKSAQEVGLDLKQLAQDVKSKAVRAILDEDLADAGKLGVQGTPYFLVNNLVVRGSITPELFADAINLALGDNLERK